MIDLKKKNAKYQSLLLKFLMRLDYKTIFTLIYLTGVQITKSVSVLVNQSSYGMQAPVVSLDFVKASLLSEKIKKIFLDNKALRHHSLQVLSGLQMESTWLLEIKVVK